MYDNILEYLQTNVWMGLPDQAQAVADIVNRSLKAEKLPEEVLASVTATSDRDAPPISMVGQVAVVELSGTLFKHANLMTRYSGGTSADSFTRSIKALSDDGNVKAVVLRVNSGGGSIMGIPQAAEAVTELAAKKTVYAIADDVMASAAFWIASGAHKIFVTPTSLVGSIGAAITFTGVHDKLKDEKLAVRIFRSAENKQVPSPVEPLSEAGAEILQARVDQAHEMFVSHLMGAMGKTRDEIDKMADGRLHMGTEAVKEGFADAVSTLEDVIQLAGSVVMNEHEIKITALTEEIETLKASIAEQKFNLDTLMKANADLKAELSEVKQRETAYSLESAIESAIEDFRIAPVRADHYRQMAADKGPEFVMAVLDALPSGQPLKETELGTDVKESQKVGSGLTAKEVEIYRNIPSLKALYNL